MGKRIKRTLVIIVALLLAVLTAWAVWAYLGSVEDEKQRGLQQVTVYRAVDLIAEGTEGSLVLSEGRAFQSMAQLRDAPADSIDSADKLRIVLTGRVAAGPISPNSILTVDQWVEKR